MNRDLKRFIILFSLISFCFIIVLVLTLGYYNKLYTKNINGALATILNEINESDSLKEEDIIEILNSDKDSYDKFLKSYGIDIENSEIILQNQNIKNKEYLIVSILIIIYLLGVVLAIIVYYKSEEKKLKNLTKMIKKINAQDYSLEINKNEEGELSSLKNELYKTALVLNEQNNNLMKDKVVLKDSLSDISHQLKTPLTGINIMLENILDNESMSEAKRKEFIKDIYHKTTKINFLVLELLKLSRFDADAITFERKKNNVQEILSEVVENVSILCDLKNITINVNGGKKETLFCDKKWQIEALTNIVKNCIEHSKEGSQIDINYQENDLFTKVIIEDYGCGISKKDIKHIFERFYKCSNSNSDSIGIGLSLAKIIIEKDNGYIVVESEVNKGTKFIIKYLK